MTAPRKISVFLASPGDLAPERRVFKETIDALNGGFGDGADVRFVPLGWEDVLAATGRRVQDVINREVDRCDVFVLALHRRWGQAAPDSTETSYTEEEFNRALARWQRSKAPTVWVFLKNVDDASLADPGPQLAKVLEFRTKLEESRHVLMRRFSTETDFGSEIDLHLRAFARGEREEASNNDVQSVRLSQEGIDALDQSVRETEEAAESHGLALLQLQARSATGAAPAFSPDLSLVKAEQEALTLTRAAIEAAVAGRTQDASILFAKATEGTTNLSVLSAAAEFHGQIGDIDNATNIVRRQAALARDRTIAARHYLGLMPAGLIETLQQQVLNQMLSQEDPEVADAIRSVHHEVYGEGRFEAFMIDLCVKHYSTAELMALARFLGTAEGQAAMQKQPLVLQEAMAHGVSEFQRVIEERYGPGDQED